MKKPRTVLPLLILPLACCLLQGCADEGGEVLSLRAQNGTLGSYGVGEAIDFSLLNVEVSFRDGSKKTLPADSSLLTHGLADTETPGEKRVLFTYGDYSQQLPYSVFQANLTLDFQGGVYQNATSLRLPFYNNRVDISSVKPKMEDAPGDAKVFSGWYVDSACSERASFLLGLIVSSREDLTLYAGYDADVSGLFTYSIDREKGEATLLKADANALAYGGGTLNIPDTVEGYPVTSIGANFLNDPFGLVQINKIVFSPKSRVRRIGANAFSNLPLLHEVVFPSGLETIEDSAFSSTGLSGKLVLPASIRSVGANAFAFNVSSDVARLESVSFEEGSQLKLIGEGCFQNDQFLSSIKLPEGLEEIRDSAFAYCTDLREIHLPSTLRVLGKGIFLAIDNLKSISVEEANPYFCSLNGDLYSKDRTVFYRYSSTKPDAEFTLPASVRRIEDEAFRLFNGFSRLQKVNLPPSLQYIGEKAFSGCSFSLSLPKELVSFSLSSFDGFAGGSIEVEEGNPKFVSVDGVLYSTDMKTLYVYPSGKEDPEFVVPDSVEALADNAFLGAENLSVLKIGEGSHLESVGSKSLACNSMRRLIYLQIDALRSFDFLKDSFYASDRYDNFTYSIVFPSSLSMDAFLGGLSGLGETTTAGHAFSLPDARTALLNRISSSFRMTSPLAYQNGAEPKIYQRLSPLDENVRSVLSSLTASYASGVFALSDLPYLSAFEKAAILTFVEEVEDGTIFGDNFMKLTFFYQNRLDALPISIADEVRKAFLTLENDGFHIISDEEKDSLCRDILDFEVEDCPTEESCLDILTRIEKTGFSNYPAPSEVTYRVSLIQVDYLIDRLLSLDLSKPEEVEEACVLINDGDGTGYGLAMMLSTGFPSESRKASICRYEEYEAFLIKLEEAKRATCLEFEKRIRNFDDGSMTWAEGYQFFLDVIQPYLNHFYSYSDDSEVLYRAFVLTGEIDMTSFVSYPEIDLSNIGMAITFISGIDNVIAYDKEPENLPHYQEYLEKKKEAMSFFDAEISWAKEAFANLDFSDGSQASSWKRLLEEEDAFGYYFLPYLGIDPNDYESYAKGTVRIREAEASYLIYCFYQRFPDGGASDVDGALTWVYGTFDEYGFQPGEGSRLDDCFEAFSRYPSYRSGVYRMDDFESDLEVLLKGDGYAWH